MICNECDRIAPEEDIDVITDREIGETLYKCPRCLSIESYIELSEYDLLEMYEELEMRYKQLKGRLENAIKD